MLDKFSSCKLIEKDHPGYVDKLIDKPHLSEEEYTGIIIKQNKNHVRKLLEKHKLSDNCKFRVAYFFPEFHHKLLNGPLPHVAKEEIAKKGSEKNIDRLVNEHDLDDCTKYEIAYRSDHEQLHNLMNKHKLNSDTARLIWRHGDDSHREKLKQLGHFDNNGKQRIKV